MKTSLKSAGRRMAAMFAITSISMLANTFTATGQTASSLRFIPESLDYGMIRETDGEVTRKVKAVNATSDTTFVISARTSCGCSSVDYNSDPIAPGDTTEVYITYDPTNRPGKFLKTIKIYTGKERVPNTFKIHGTVIPSKKHLDKTYPEKAGTLRLTTLLVNCGELRPNEVRPYFVGIYNDSDSPIALKCDSDSERLEVSLLPDTIEPNSISTVTMKLRTGEIKQNEFNYNAYIIDAETGKALVKIPIGGTIRQPSAAK